MIGIKSLGALKIRHSEDREEFLIHLSVPGYFYYYKYSILRPVSDNIAPWNYTELESWDTTYEYKWYLENGEFWSERACRPHPHRIQDDDPHMDHLKLLFWTYKYRVEYLHLQLTMQRHHLGPSYGISLDNLSLIQVIEKPLDFVDCVALVSAEARIRRHDDREKPGIFILTCPNLHLFPSGGFDYIPILT